MKYGLKVTIIICSLSNTIASCIKLIGYTRNGYVFALIGNAFAGFGHSFLFYVATKLAVEWFGEKRGTHMSVAGMVMNLLGVALGFLMGRFLIPASQDYDGAVKHGLFVSLLWQAVACIILLIISCIFIQKDSPTETQIAIANRRLTKFARRNSLKSHDLAEDSVMPADGVEEDNVMPAVTLGIIENFSNINSANIPEAFEIQKDSINVPDIIKCTQKDNFEGDSNKILGNESESNEIQTDYVDQYTQLESGVDFCNKDVDNKFKSIETQADSLYALDSMLNVEPDNGYTNSAESDSVEDDNVMPADGVEEDNVMPADGVKEDNVMLAVKQGILEDFSNINSAIISESCEQQGDFPNTADSILSVEPDNVMENGNTELSEYKTESIQIQPDSTTIQNEDVDNAQKADNEYYKIKIDYVGASNSDDLEPTGFLDSCELLVKMPSFHLLVHSYGIFNGLFVAVISLFNQMSTEHFPTEETLISFMGFACPLCAILGILLSCVLVDKTRRYRMVSIAIFTSCMVSFIVFTVVLKYSGSIALTFVCFCVYGINSNSFMAVGLKYAADIVFPTNESSIVTIMLTSTSLYGFALTYIIGKIVEKFGSDIGGYCITGLYIIGLICIALVQGELKTVATDQTEEVIPTGRNESTISQGFNFVTRPSWLPSGVIARSNSYHINIGSLPMWQLEIIQSLSSGTSVERGNNGSDIQITPV